MHTSLVETMHTREEPKRSTIFATELMAIIDPPFQGSALRKVDASGSESQLSSWQAIVKHVDVVGVCAKLGSAIEPLIPRSTPMCPSCYTVPAQRYYLAAHVQCLVALSKRAKLSTNDLNNGCRIGPRTFWYTESSPWSSCPSPDHARIQKGNSPYEGLQYILTKKPRETLSIVAPDQVEDDGIVVTSVDNTDVVDTGVVLFGREHSGIEKWREKIRLYLT
ncbi:hypothetical protein CCUS01_08820 [Colletotrichum cuscutae]|uniref:Uncharacterized protein n=1 Tax=Colletotrichum cuscutae TaxID=1209917 RepID=A0AAI9UQ11_9PEZI|nr:hypothetical protein CCUS01_08820 [Colletotrichum cuscutae]